VPAPAIELYDATLRDGMQGEGLTLSAHEKLRVPTSSTSSAST
jgi:2-isopropylmalate synthase